MLDKWNILRKEYEAKAEKFFAEKKLEYQNTFDSLNDQANSVSEWTEDTWDEFSTKAEKAWQDLKS